MSASDGAGGSRVTDLFDRASEAGGLSEIIRQGIGAVFFAFGSAIASGVLTLADLIIVPLTVLTTQGGNLIEAVFGGSALIIDTGAATTAISLGPAGTFNVGPFTFALAIGAVLLALYTVRAYLADEATSNFFPGLADVPTPGFGFAEEDE